MQKTIELLKSKGILDKLQENLSAIKPPIGTSEKQIMKAIENCVELEMARDPELEGKFIDAIYDDAFQAIRKELKIEFVEPKDFFQNSLTEMLSSLFGNANVHVHVVHVDEEKKGKGEEA